MKNCLWLGVAILLAACANRHPSITPKFADLTTADVTIESVDGDWRLESGKPFTPPVINDLSSGSLPAAFVQKNTGAYSREDIAEHTMDVVVTVKETGEKLNGKILFLNVYENAGSASAKRKWTVAVPDQYLEIASSGNVAVVFQPYSYNGKQWVSWALWMSSLPL